MMNASLLGNATKLLQKRRKLKRHGSKPKKLQERSAKNFYNSTKSL